MSTRAQMPLPLPAVTECGYCERLLTAPVTNQPKDGV